MFLQIIFIAWHGKSNSRDNLIKNSKQENKMKHYKVVVENLDGMFDHAELFSRKDDALSRAQKINCPVFQGNYPDITGIHGNAFSFGREYKIK
jgi:hypothetical protein